MSAGSDRLERSRLAILEHVHRKELRRQGRPAAEGSTAAVHAGDAGTEVDAPGARPGGGPAWFEAAQDMLDGWWRYHPAHLALDIARPALTAYARRSPLLYLGAAAAAGAAVFYMRPWKLISVTGVLLAIVKSPQVASLAMRALSAGRTPPSDGGAVQQ
ncbi:hypothetical protein [Ramlibacter sp.]|uniref:hypothetical protein n=1 Tax=Ramlibacter sp. TaxID=1917967 RepID=UPI002D3A2612|nr:hypothetical protein [Ramlibacter sp.]HYD75893.1 hypothetical protein [Ramlibacter sp.]